ncbi:MAG: hypothetical protein LBV33_05920 [Lachnospiraceae bacterium]|nr:hypothetical protein [Lachnospiraceae bacterium]
MFKLLNENDLPEGFVYPQPLHKLIELNLTNFEVWYLMDYESAKVRMSGLDKRYPQRVLIPFARRGDCDDIACFEAGQGQSVFVIHDFASEGYEQREIFENIWDWLNFVIMIMIDFEKMEMSD